MQSGCLWQDSLRKNSEPRHSSAPKSRKTMSSSRYVLRIGRGYRDDNQQKMTRNETHFCLSCRQSTTEDKSYFARCCCRTLHFLCQDCYITRTTFLDGWPMQCCSTVFYKNCFKVPDAIINQQQPNCDACLLYEPKYALPCEHKICLTCYKKNLYVKLIDTDTGAKQQWWINCDIHDKNHLFTIKRVHTMARENGRYLRRLGCVECRKHIVGNCVRLKCNHFACEQCIKRGLHRCPMCDEDVQGEEVNLTGSEQDFQESLSQVVTFIESENENTQVKDPFFTTCTFHQKKVFAALSCSEFTCVCIECIADMVINKDNYKINGSELVKEYAICTCSKLSAKHLLPVKYLKIVASRKVYVKDLEYGCCSTCLCWKEALLQIDDCGHSYCKGCVRRLLDSNESVTMPVTQIHGDRQFVVCSVYNCQGTIPLDQLNQCYKTNSTEEKLDVKIQENVFERKGVQKGDLSLSGEELPKTPGFRGQGSAVSDGTQSNNSPRTKKNEKAAQGKLSLNREASSRDKETTARSPEDRQTPSMSPSTSVTEEKDFDMLENTLNEKDGTSLTLTPSDITHDTERCKNHSPKNKSETYLKEMPTSSFCSQDKCQKLKEVKQKIHFKTSSTIGCSTMNCSKEAVVTFCDCCHRKCIDCLLEMPEETEKAVCGIGFWNVCKTEIPMQPLKEYIMNIKKKSATYLKEKPRWGKCSQAKCSKTAVVEFRACSHRMCNDCAAAKVSERRRTMICKGLIKYTFHCTHEIPTKIVREYLHNYGEEKMEWSSVENMKDVCDNPDCEAEKSMKGNIRQTLSCNHRLCIICFSAQKQNKGDVIKCKVPTCTSSQGKSKIQTPSDIKPEILGIPNIGLTCYASCVLQVLGQTPGFKDILNKYCFSSGENHMETLLKKLLENVNVGEESNYVLNWRLMEQLMARIFRIDESFRRYQENDCHSFIMSLLNALMKEETEKKKHPENAEKTIGCDTDSDEATVTKKSTAEKIDSCRSKEVVAPQRKKEKSSCPTTLFESRLTSLFTYNDCSHEENVDDQLFYSLLIPVREDVYSLENGLDVFFNREEFSQGALPCRECNVRREKTITTRSLQMSEAPKILMLQLARFEEVSTVVDGYLKELRKTDHPVKFQMTLRVNRDYTIDKKELEYELYGVVLHRGSMLGGHYTSYVRKQHTNRWFYCSDSTVREIKEERIFQEGIARNAYVLFYSRKT
ncbi:uncharacterized protein LOC110456411 isoform X2 [Mizuhopecten yessoensis]|uniref:uncharacterized protein LOC110456411 isoform X2 n=1 Tax=Mizuhopecten yessoensis TaxID=6573 RepID=UPI000B45A9E7|nr:uncharacterized protein LOC110456411 isoform X2 [Mizuhopecten yessoensis]